MATTRESRPLIALIMGMAALMAAAGSGGIGVVAQNMDCTSPIITLSPCLYYIIGNVDSIPLNPPQLPGRPTNDCCTQVATIAISRPDCLCQLLATQTFLGLTVNQTLILSLPSACNIYTLQCSGLYFAPPAGSSPPPSFLPVAPAPFHANLPATPQFRKGGHGHHIAPSAMAPTKPSNSGAGNLYTPSIMDVSLGLIFVGIFL